MIRIMLVILLLAGCGHEMCLHEHQELESQLGECVSYAEQTTLERNMCLQIAVEALGCCEALEKFNHDI